MNNHLKHEAFSHPELIANHLENFTLRKLTFKNKVVPLYAIHL